MFSIELWIYRHNRGNSTDYSNCRHGGVRIGHAMLIDNNVPLYYLWNCRENSFPFVSLCGCLPQNRCDAPAANNERHRHHRHAKNKLVILGFEFLTINPINKNTPNKWLDRALVLQLQPGLLLLLLLLLTQTTWHMKYIRENESNINL